ncbi:hypothetical protein GGF46_001845 [Coemansia sp. RSA 552]|nr:hypothetical protein GGF46_001845 [Coemansia sp. RSA 552]
MHCRKNYTKGYSPMQMKVREATSKDSRIPTVMQMSEIAQSTYNQTDFLGVMDIIDKRMNDKGRLWQHVFKSLYLLHFLLFSGSPLVMEYSVDNLFIVKTLREFQHIDDQGHDRGANVRDRAKLVTTLLTDRSLLEQERKGTCWMQHFSGATNDPFLSGGYNRGYNHGYASSSGRLPYGNSRPSGARPAHHRGGSLSAASAPYGDDDKEMRRAIAESKRSSASKKVPANYDEDAELKRALEESAREARAEESKSKALVSTKEVDLIGGLDDDPPASTALASASNLGMMGGSASNFNMMNGSASNFGMANNSSSISFSQQQSQQQFAMSSSATGDLLGGNGQMSSNNQFSAMSSMNASSNMNTMGSGAGGDMSSLMNSMNLNNAGAGNNNFDPFGLGGMSNAGSSSNMMGAGMSAGMTPGMGSGMGMANQGMSMPMPMGVTSPVTTSTPGAFNTSSNQFTAQSSMTATQMESSNTGGANPFGQSNMQQQPMSANIFDNPQSAGSNNLLGMSSAGGTSSAGGFGGASGAFGNAFDGGMGAKALPFGVNPDDPNSKIAEIARNSDKIDPFASLAMGSTSSASNPFGSSTMGPSSAGQNMGASTALTTSMAGMPGTLSASGMSGNMGTPGGMSNNMAGMSGTMTPSMSNSMAGMPNAMTSMSGMSNNLTSMSGMSNTMTSMAGTPGAMSGGSSLLDFSSTQSASVTASSQQAFGQANRNPFASGGATAGNTQPSMNQLMSSGASSSNAMAASANNMFSQQQNSDGLGNFSNSQAQSQQYAFQQQQQQTGMPQNNMPQQQLNMPQQNNMQQQQFDMQQLNMSQQNNMQQQQMNPFAPNTAIGNGSMGNQLDFFGR